jgi:hypothetical protein
MQLDYRCAPGPLMQPIGVLSYDGAQQTGAFKLG